MKKIITFLTIGILSLHSSAQNLPQISPLSTIKQTVGLTDFTVEYSRPSVKGRTIFGELVPFDKVWRLGANKCTQFTVSTEVTIAGETLKAGTYSMFATPSKSGDWTVVFNSNTEQWGAGEYDAEKNLITAKVKAVKNTFTESFMIGFNNFTSNSGAITIQWENLKIDIPFKVNTTQIAEQNIKSAIEKGEKLGRVYYNSADYYLKANDTKKASMYIEKSIAIEKTHGNLFLQANILNKMDKKDEAIKLAKQAAELAEKAESKGWVNYINETIEKWNK